jgi:hypothetical protein
MDVLIVPAVLAVIALALIAKSVLVVPKGTSVVLGKLGRADRTLGPGLHIVVPFITSVMARLPAGEQELDVAAAAGQLRDGTGASVRGTVRYRMADAARAMNDVADYRKAVAQLASTHWLRALEHADLAGARDALPSAIPHMQTAARNWGIEIVGATPLLDFSSDAVAGLRAEALLRRHERVRAWLSERGESPGPDGVPTVAQDAAYEAWATAPADLSEGAPPDVGTEPSSPAPGLSGLSVAVARVALGPGGTGTVEIDGRQRVARNGSSGVIQAGFRCVVEREDDDTLIVRPL